MKISNSELKVVRFANEDVIATSFYIQVNPYKDGYIIAEGSIPSYGAYNPETQDWLVQLKNGTFQELTSDEVDAIKENRSAQYNSAEVYDVYYPENSLFARTKGASYWELYGNGQ